MLFPYTETSRVALRPAGAQDARAVYDILFRLGHSGLPVVDAFVEGFARRVAACFLVQDKDSDSLVGFGTLSELTPAGHLRAEVVLADGHPDELRVDATALIVNFAFAMWRTRKVYFHVTGQSSPTLGFGSDHAAMVRAEAVLPDYTYFHGRLWDVQVCAIHRTDWNSQGTDLLKQLI